MSAQSNNVRSVRPVSNNNVAAAPAPALKPGKQYVKTTANLRKQTANCAVYQSRALGSTYIPMVNFPEGEDVPTALIITIEKAG